MNREERQGYRDGQSGRYLETRHCETCDAPLAEYLSDHRVDTVFQGEGLVLCSKCAEKLRPMEDDVALFWMSEMKRKLAERKRKRQERR